MVYITRQLQTLHTDEMPILEKKVKSVSKGCLGGTFLININKGLVYNYIGDEVWTGLKSFCGTPFGLMPKSVIVMDRSIQFRVISIHWEWENLNLYVLRW